MNTLAKIALGTVATGAVALAAMSPVMAAPQTPAVDMAVATPTTVSAPAPAYLGSNSTMQAPAPAVAAPAPAVKAPAPLASAHRITPVTTVAPTTATRIGHQHPGEFGYEIINNNAANHINDF